MKKILVLCAIGLIVITASAQQNFKKVVTGVDSVKFLNEDYFAIKKESKWGVMKNSTLILDYYYDAIDVLSDGIITFIKGNQAGFADTLGNIITYATYDLETPYERKDASPLNIFSSGSALVSLNGKLMLLGKDNKPVMGDTVEIISKFDNTVIFKKDGAYGMADAMGHVTAPNRYRQIQIVIAGELYAYTGQQNGMDVLGFIDSKGTVKSPAQFEDMTVINKGDNYYVKAFVNTGKQALYDSHGNQIFSPLYQNIEPTLSNKYFVMTDNTRKGIIGRDYVTYIPAGYDNISVVGVGKDTFFVAMQDNMTYILNDKNGTVASFEGNLKDFVSYRNGELIFIADSMLNFGVRSSEKGWLIQPQYLDIFAEVNGIYIVRKKDKWGAIDINNNEVIPQQYKKIRASNAKTCLVFYEGKNNSVVLTDKGKLLYFPKTDNVLPTEQYVEYKDKKQKVRLYLDGREIRNDFLSVGSEFNGKITAQTKQGWSYYDAKTNEPLTDQFYTYATPLRNNRAFVVKDKQLLYIDDNFNVIETILDENYKSLAQVAAMLYLSKTTKKLYVTAKDKNDKLTLIRIMK